MSVEFSYFLADQVSAGSLLGLRRGSSLADVTNALGAESYVDVSDKRKRSMRRDYGLVELAFNSDPVLGWVCTNAMLQVHRLRWGTTVPAAIRDEVHTVPSVVPLIDFQQAVVKRGGSLVKQSDLRFSDFEYYSVSDSDGRVSVLTEDEDGLLVANCVWSIALW